MAAEAAAGREGAHRGARPAQGQQQHTHKQSESNPSRVVVIDRPIQSTDREAHIHTRARTSSHVQGPLVGKVMAEQIRWQVEHPEGGKEAATAHLKAFVAAGCGDGDGGGAKA